jgi:chromosome segregation protein
LRTFLEEAAGISKYRERRRETELRLEDTRENLARVDDILQELDKQLEHLEGQAEVAAKYRTLESELKLTQQLLWLLRRQDAAHQRTRLTRDMEQINIQLEAETARLRELEKALEQSRQTHYAQSDAVHAEQGRLYEANAEVARVEQSLAHKRDSQRRVESQLRSVQEEHTQGEAEDQELRAALAAQREALALARSLVAERREEHMTLAAALPEAESQSARTRGQVEGAQQETARCEQAIQVETTRDQHAQRVLLQLEQRRQRLENERLELERAKPEGLEQLERELADAQFQYDTKRDALNDAEAALPGAEEAHRIAADAADAAGRELQALEARCTALELLQRQVSRSGEMHAWLDNHQLDGFGRLWQGLRVEPGWEDALEAVLRERLNGIALDDLQRAAGWLDQPPPGKVSFFQRGEGPASATELPGRKPLLTLITCADARVAMVLSDWLDRVYVVRDAADGFAERATLPAGAILVCPQGHVFTRNSASFHAADSEVHGILARQREIEELRRKHALLEEEAVQSRAKATEAQEELRERREQALDLRGEAEGLRQQCHDLQLDHVRASEQADRALQRTSQIERELEEIRIELEHERAQRDSAQQTRLQLESELQRLRERLDTAREADHAASVMLTEKRQAVQAAQTHLQEADFQDRVAAQKIGDIERNLQALAEKQSRLAASAQTLAQELAGLDPGPLQGELEQALGLRVERERVLAQAREALDEAERLLKETDQQRLACEQRLHPLRDRLSDLRLKEQEARIAEENFAQQLAAVGADEGYLASKVEKGMRPNALQADINRLSEEIAALGAVNLAALEELQAGRERKNYLDAQSLDLREAVETLENAIRRIDKETRERLQGTFDQVNENLQKMFPALFGGGEARLIMTGEEILDAGLQIIARPPGKRNTSIHLLSGGEKALTALALVFSLFQLNPAPFCLLDEVDAPLDDTNTERFCDLVRKMSEITQFLFISHNKITMEMAAQLVGITMPEQGVSKVVAVDIEEALRLTEEAA